MLKRLLLVVAIIGALGCGKGNPTDPDESDDSYKGTTINGTTLVLYVDGTPFTSTQLSSSIIPGTGGTPDYLDFGAVNLSDTFGFDVPAAVGLYQFQTTFPLAAIHTDLTGGGAGWWAFSGIGGTGTIEIKTRTSNTFSGVFDFIVIPLSGAATVQRRLNGSFITTAQ